MILKINKKLQKQIVNLNCNNWIKMLQKRRNKKRIKKINIKIKLRMNAQTKLKFLEPKAISNYEMSELYS